MELIDGGWDAMVELAKVGQYSSKSDLEVGAKAMEAGLYGSYRNVLINLGGIKDDAFRADMEQRAARLMKRGEEKLVQIRDIIDARTGDV
jgi:glutamate formiminotransferase/formiminotetrahydrofolate cyclodeaminase